MSKPSSGSTSNGAGSERLDAPEDLGSMSEIQQQLSVHSRQMGQILLRFTDSERHRAEEAANAAAMQVAEKAEEARGKRGEASNSITLACHLCSHSREI